MLEPDQLLLLLNPQGKSYLRRADPSDELQGNDGVLPLAEVIAAGYGSVVHTRKGIPYRVLRPTLYDLLRTIKSKTSVIYAKDIGYICVKLGVGPGRKMIEAGAGSGALTMAMSFFAGDSGEVHSHEQRPEVLASCRSNLNRVGLGANVTLYQQDVSEGFCTADADALFLDMRDAHTCVRHIPAATRPGAMLGFLVPTTNQVSHLLVELEQGPFDQVEVCELILRPWKPVPDRLRPKDRMNAHNGFLVFARHQAGGEALEPYRQMGTRERKRAAAKKGRRPETSEPPEAKPTAGPEGSS